jgi:hypothetical protein
MKLVFESQCLARRVAVPFYRAKGMVYNACFTVADILYYWKAYITRLTCSLHCKAWTLLEALQRACLELAVRGISV